ncbi:hypothetical protein K7W42_02770 [Deinococcus sp. HMF7604]|uniref:hypothetical protein n=1 Tax=Deinococcus betulae TaxID=2873312 RepID=UPI001CCA7FFD|nr:hypothetical protein [Deinococcus betulae]MBZ9749780.1 hypothetical protein [Deinococcus betulae]
MLRTPPTRVSAPALSDALARIEQVRALDIASVDLADVPDARKGVLVRHAQTVRVQVIARMAAERRQATLLVFLQHLERTATDDALAVFDALMGKLATTGEARRKVDRLRTLRDLDHAALLLRAVASIVMDSEIPAQGIREAVRTCVSELDVQDAMATVALLASEDDDPAPEALLGSYTTVRKFLPRMLHSITFEGTPSAKPLLDAWAFLGRIEQGGRPKPRWADAPRMVVTRTWERRVFPRSGEVNHQAYTLCVLERLQHALRRREVFVTLSVAHADPRAELLQGDAWLTARDDVVRALNRSAEPGPELERLRAELDIAYRAVAQGLPGNESLQLTTQDGHTRLTLTTSDPLEDTASLNGCGRRWPPAYRPSIWPNC